MSIRESRTVSWKSHRLPLSAPASWGMASLRCSRFTDIQVRVYEQSPNALASLQGKIRTNLRDLGQDPSAADLVTPCGELAQAVREAGIVFEAGPENLDLKRDLFQLVERAAPEDALLASNTSVIPITQIMAGLRHRGGHSVRTGGTRHTSCPWSK